MPFEATRGDYVVSDEEARLDLDVVEALMRQTYWAPNRTRAQLERSIRHSMNFGVYRVADGAQIAFARVVTDATTFAWLCDVFVDPAHRGIGLGKLLVESILAHPELQSLRRWILATRDAHGLYAQFGFVPLANPQVWMERLRDQSQRVDHAPLGPA